MDDRRDARGPVGTGAGELAGHDPGHHQPEDYYYTRMFTDAARAVDVALELGPVRRGRAPGRGHRRRARAAALALAAAALQRDAVRVCHADVPFLCDIQRAITLAPHAPYTEIPEFLAENVALIDTALNTLRYIDCALLARRITATTLISVGLMDDHLPAVNGLRRLQRDNRGQGHRRVPVQRAQRGPHAHAERQLRTCEPPARLAAPTSPSRASPRLVAPSRG